MAGDYLAALERLGVALALGLLIGLERGWESRELPEGSRVAGFRTFAIISLLGAVITLLSPDSLVPFAAGLLALGAAGALGYWRESEHQHIGLTTEIAALLTFGLGALAGKGEFIVASSTAVIVAILLGFKPELHRFLQRIEREELLATLRLLLISVVILPILPNRGFGPWQAVNPYRLWWLVVLVAGLSYVGYFGIKLLGRERGVLVSGLLGGLVSSTAVAVNFSRLARDKPRNQALLASGVIVASATMFPRMLVMVAVVAPDLALSLFAPLLAAAIVPFAFGAWYVWRGSHQALDADEKLEPRNPLSLSSAIEFGLLLAVIMLMARAFGAWLGDRGLLAIGAISGLADVDAITVSVSSMFHAGQTAAAVATAAILTAAAVNTVVKAALVAAIGGARMGFYVALPLLAALAAGAAAWWLH
jgi:uncharacterized membrane protein (DUF4010 family)